MPKVKISEYSTVNTDNSDIEGINISEGCAPSGINNAIRELMVHLKEFQTGASGDAFTFAGGVLISGSLNTATGAMIMSGANVIAHAAGTVSAPSIYANGDTNTGIFFPAADTIAFAEGGAEAMRINSSGNFAIGSTSTFGLRMQVVGAAASDDNGGGTGAESILGLTDTTSFAAGVGGAIGFNGYYDATPNRATFGVIRGIKENATSGNFASAMTFFTRANGGSLNERMRIDSSGNVGIGTSSVSASRTTLQIGSYTNIDNAGDFSYNATFNSGWNYINSDGASQYYAGPGLHVWSTAASGTAGNAITFTERMRIDSSGNVGIGTTSASGYRLTVYDTTNTYLKIANSTTGTTGSDGFDLAAIGSDAYIIQRENAPMLFYTNATERARITSAGALLVGKTARDFGVAGLEVVPNGNGHWVSNGTNIVAFNRLTDDGVLIEFAQASTVEGNISVSGATVSYNAFCGSHWSQLQQGRGYNPEILRGTVMSSIGEMAEWKSVTWTETIEHPAVPAVEAKEAVLDEEGNVVEPAVEAVEGKDAWTESFDKRENYLGNLPIGATFEEDGFTKTVVDDGNERLPRVKISDVVGDKAVYGVFQTWDEVQDMLVSSLGAFVVRIAAGVTVQIGDLLESNGDGCAKVQDDDVIRSKTIGKVTSTVATATYADGSYTVPCVLYCG